MKCIANLARKAWGGSNHKIACGTKGWRRIAPLGSIHRIYTSSAKFAVLSRIDPSSFA